MQGKEEKVTDYIRRLEKVFQVAYGRDDLADETRDTLLYGQLYEGILCRLLLCLVAKRTKDCVLQLRGRRGD